MSNFAELVRQAKERKDEQRTRQRINKLAGKHVTAKDRRENREAVAKLGGPGKHEIFFDPDKQVFVLRPYIRGMGFHTPQRTTTGALQQGPFEGYWLGRQMGRSVHRMVHIDFAVAEQQIRMFSTRLESTMQEAMAHLADEMARRVELEVLYGPGGVVNPHSDA